MSGAAFLTIVGVLLLLVMGLLVGVVYFYVRSTAPERERQAHTHVPRPVCSNLSISGETEDR